MGLVGQFNEALAGFTRETLKGFPGPKKIWAVGERLHSHLLDPDLPVVAVYRPPNSAKAITALVGRILAESRTETLYIFHNRPDTTAPYRQVVQQLLPLDEKWIREMAAQPWITGKLPEVLPPFEQTLAALISEFLFVSLFKACSQSMAAENTTRLHAMQRAEKNIEELLKDLQQDYHSQRQNAIDEELFDIISGFEALNI
jgi:F-type H+-transporting ATPase subunit gamma